MSENRENPRTSGRGAVNQTTKNMSPVDPIFISLIAAAVGVLAIGVVAFWELWNASPAVVKHVTCISSALAPGLTFLSVIVAAIVTAIGWYVKRKITNEAVRGRMRARIERVRGAIMQAVSSEKPYKQGSIKDFLGSIKFFLDEIQKFYWEVATFDAFLRRELDVLRKALDYCQLDNDNATRMAKDPETWNPGECFRRSLAALELVFRDVFRD